MLSAIAAAKSHNGCVKDENQKAAKGKATRQAARRKENEVLKMVIDLRAAATSEVRHHNFYDVLDSARRFELFG